MSLMITMKKDNRQISTCVYMAGLAIVDTCVLLFSEILWKLLISHGLGPGLESNFAFLSAMWYGADGFAVVSGLFLAEMSVDRAIAVTYPMKAATICTAKRAVKVTITTCVLEMTFMIQTFFVLTLPDPPTGVAIRDVNQATWFVEFYNYNLLILGTILPFSIIATCNIIILIGVQRAAVRRKQMKSSTADDNEKKLKDTNLTAMLLMTSLAYLLCSCPKRIYESVAVVDLSNPYWTARYWLGYWVVVEIWTLNFAVNFYVYFLKGGRKFRQDATKFFTASADD
ncbi:uncharacterized protein LOC135483044 [Lineus longissimus]|uniref:uncharacterized protein LOC135483044 n=1 Tax=Lineus longissimus TaxID=88925 RepID=UPI00315D5AA6